MDWLFLISRVIYPGVLKSQAPDAIIIAAGFKLRVFSFMSILRALYESGYKAAVWQGGSR